MRARELGIARGSGRTGRLDKITDVPGVLVGHSTVISENHNTGVTVVIPGSGNPYTEKFPAAFHAANGFGKSLGGMQIEEMGTLETPIALTNTLNVGIVHDSLVQYMVDMCERDCVELKSVNPAVMECNDWALNDIRERAVTRENVFEAINGAEADFALGSVGAGRGTTCFGLKGGIGSASRIVTLDGMDYTVGVLCQTNFGKIGDLSFDGKNIGKDIEPLIGGDGAPEKGSCIAVMATDIPLSSRQIKRVIRRLAVGLIRCGSFLGNGSGEVFIGFSTANRVSQDEEGPDIIDVKILNEGVIDSVFRAAAEAAEEAVADSMTEAGTVSVQGGNTRVSVTEFIGKEWK